MMTTSKRIANARLMADGIELASIDLPNHPLLAGDVLPVRLNWRVDAETGRDLTVFLHVLDAEGEIVAQSDRRPFDGRFPTAVWRAEEEYSDTALIVLPPGMATGRYSLRVGLYDVEGRLLRNSGADDNLLVEGVLSILATP